MVVGILRVDMVGSTRPNMAILTFLKPLGGTFKNVSVNWSCLYQSDSLQSEHLKEVKTTKITS